MNGALALKTMEVLRSIVPASLETIQKGMRETRWQGRMETILPGVIADGAHNEDGVAKFVETAVHFQEESPLTLLFSAVDDKDYPDMIHTICKNIRFRNIVVTEVGGYRMVPAKKLAELFQKEGYEHTEACPEIPDAFDRALELRGEDGLLFCVGSLYLVGEIKSVIRKRRKHD